MYFVEIYFNYLGWGWNTVEREIQLFRLRI